MLQKVYVEVLSNLFQAIKTQSRHSNDLSKALEIRKTFLEILSLTLLNQKVSKSFILLEQKAKDQHPN
jgi:hypothetical protein